MINISVDSRSVDKTIGNVNKQLDFALVRVANVLAFGVRDSLKDQMRTKFTNPTPWTMRSINVIKATKQQPAAFVHLRTDQRQHRALGHHFVGGKRPWKRMEGRLYRTGILGASMPAIPGAAAAKNVYGNIRPSLVKQIFDALENGSPGRSGSGKRTRLGKSQGGYVRIGARQYFVSSGKGAGQPLRRGIWSKKGEDVDPVLMFTREGSYQKRFDWLQTFDDVLKKNGGINALVWKHFKEAMDTAR